MLNTSCHGIHTAQNANFSHGLRDLYLFVWIPNTRYIYVIFVVSHGYLGSYVVKIATYTIPVYRAPLRIATIYHYYRYTNWITISNPCRIPHPTIAARPCGQFSVRRWVRHLILLSTEFHVVIVLTAPIRHECYELQLNTRLGVTVFFSPTTRPVHDKMKNKNKVLS